MKAPKLRAVTPMWAESIEVERRKDSLLITGWRHRTGPLDTRGIEAGRISQVDILKRLNSYVLKHLGNRSIAGDAGVYQFADASEDEKLLRFCEEFGPVWGEVRSRNYDENGTCTLTVAQNMSRLREDQKKFAAVLKLLQQVNRPTKADGFTMRNSISDFQSVDPEVLSTIHLIGSLPNSTRSGRGRYDFWMPFAHLALCAVLNDVPQKLMPFDRGVIDLPDTRAEGVRNALYYSVRRDYLAQREIGTCLHCGSHFPIFKHGARGCSQACRTALRNQKYWSENKETVNRSRRKKHTGRK